MTFSAAAMTTGPACVALGYKNSRSVRKLVRVGWINTLGTVGRTLVLDPTDVASLAAMPILALPLTGALAGIVVSTDALSPDLQPGNGRPYAGWCHPNAVVPPMSAGDRVLAVSGWWGTGEALACELDGLLFIQTTSGVVGDVSVIDGHRGHPFDPALIDFQLTPADPEVAAPYLGHRFAYPAGAAWKRLRV